MQTELERLLTDLCWRIENVYFAAQEVRETYKLEKLLKGGTDNDADEQAD